MKVPDPSLTPVPLDQIPPPDWTPDWTPPAIQPYDIEIETADQGDWYARFDHLPTLSEIRQGVDRHAGDLPPAYIRALREILRYAVLPSDPTRSFAHAVYHPDSRALLGVVIVRFLLPLAAAAAEGRIHDRT